MVVVDLVAVGLVRLVFVGARFVVGLVVGDLGFALLVLRTVRLGLGLGVTLGLFGTGSIAMVTCFFPLDIRFTLISLTFFHPQSLKYFSAALTALMNAKGASFRLSKT